MVFLSIYHKNSNDFELLNNSLEKLKLSQETNYQKSLEAKQKAQDNLTKGYEDALNTVSNAFLDNSHN